MQLHSQMSFLVPLSFLQCWEQVFYLQEKPVESTRFFMNLFLMMFRM